MDELGASYFFGVIVQKLKYDDNDLHIKDVVTNYLSLTYIQYSTYINQQPINQLTQRNHNHCCFVLFICFEYGFHFAEIFDFSKKIPRWAGHREVIVLKLPTKLCSEPANAGFDSGCPANPKIQNCKICEDSIHFLRRNYR